MKYNTPSNSFSLSETIVEPNPTNLFGCRENNHRMIVGTKSSTFFFKKISTFHLNYSSSSSPSLQQISYDLATCIASLQSCAQHNYLTKGKQLHTIILRNNLFTSPVSITSLINMYSKCSCISYALSVFESSIEYRNVYAWNAVISGCISNGLLKDGYEFYQRMLCEGVIPDKFTFPGVIKACFSRLGIRKVHGLVLKYKLELDVFIGSALVNCYLKFGLMQEAQKVFEDLPVRDDVVLWNALINGYGQIGQLDMVLETFKRMRDEGVAPNKFTVTGVLSVLATTGDLNNGRLIHGFVTKKGYESGVAVLNALIDVYGKCRCTGDALVIFEMMGEKDIFSWNSIITVHEQSGDHEGTLKLFKRMLWSRVVPDIVTFTTVIPACSHLAALLHGKEIHGHMIINGFGSEKFDDIYVNNAVMDMYAKCGSMKEAHLVFDKMSDKDVASWNIMIKGYGLHGHGHEALHIFYCMCEERFKPDEVTFVGALSACNHAGFVSQGHEFLANMKSKYNVIPTVEHYTCMIDMLGRAGRLDEAYELATTMPIEANSVLWRAFLWACQLHGNSDMAEIAAQRVFELEPKHCGSYVLMSNVYGASGRYEEVLEMRDKLRQQDVSKTPGCSWIELNNGVHSFVSGDRSHPETNNIYIGLKSLTGRLHEYVPDV